MYGTNEATCDEFQRAADDDCGWAELIPAEQWSVYERVMRSADGRGIPFAVGGGFAFSYYARRWRNTKDMDLYIRPEDREKMIQVVGDEGLKDYFDVSTYDRGWIYRSHNGHGIIVDLIWQMANYRTRVNDDWVGRGPFARIRGRAFRLIPPEELLWSKLYILQRDRCDWPDLLNVIGASGPGMDWERLIATIGEDRRVLGALLTLFTWACPGKARELPVWLWEALKIPAPAEEGPAVDQKHIRLMDSRDWFGPTARR